MKQKHFIDSHKGATPLFVLGCMAWYQQWDNPTAWAYLATHGTYGILWVIKSNTFGDRQWEQPCSPGYAVVIWGGLSLYWVAPWIITSQDVRAPAWWLGAAVAVWGLGVFYHFASDMQKHITLSLKPGLIQDGLWARVRNPNYFGELLIYAGFSSLAMHWAPFVALAIFVGAVWIPNMVKKDRSISRHAGFAEYKKRSKLFIPFVI